MTEQYAPVGKIWFCMMCGKTTKDCYGSERGWDESCVMNCILVDETTKQPTAEQVQEFSLEHERQLARLTANIATLMQKLRDGVTDDIDPEMLELAQQAVDALDRREEETQAQESDTTRKLQ